MIQSLASLNNDGARNITSNNYDAAISSFLRCIRLTRQSLHEIESSGATCELQRPHQADAEHGLKHEFLDVEQHCAASQPQDSFVFKKVAVITACGSDDRATLTVSLFNLALVSLYNLGLAHHLSGLQMQCRARLERAKSYYELSFKLHEQQDGASFHLLHSVSVLNNIGAIHHVLNEKETSERFFSKLLSALNYLRENGGVDPLDGSWSGFWSNASASLISRPSAAPAA